MTRRISRRLPLESGRVEHDVAPALVDEHRMQVELEPDVRRRPVDGGGHGIEQPTRSRIGTIEDDDVSMLPLHRAAKKHREALHRTGAGAEAPHVRPGKATDDGFQIEQRRIAVGGEIVGSDRVQVGARAVVDAVERAARPAARGLVYDVRDEHRNLF